MEHDLARDAMRSELESTVRAELRSQFFEICWACAQAGKPEAAWDYFLKGMSTADAAFDLAVDCPEGSERPPPS